MLSVILLSNSTSSFEMEIYTIGQEEYGKQLLDLTVIIFPSTFALYLFLLIT